MYIGHVPFTYDYPRPSLTVDCVVFGFDPHDKVDPLKVLLIKRLDDPFKGKWALPGGFVNVSDEGSQGESAFEAAQRELSEETGITVGYMEQLYTFDTPGRDPRGRVVSIAYFALVKTEDHAVQAGSDAGEAIWVNLSKVNLEGLAFDHGTILRIGLMRLENKVRWSPIGLNLLPEEFTLGELQRLYEAVLQRSLDKRNFRRKILSMGILREVGVDENRPTKPVRVYRFDQQAYDSAVRKGFNFEI